MSQRLRSNLIFGFMLVAVFLSTQASAITYTLSPVTYTSKVGSYSSTTGVTGSFTTTNPLPANLTDARIATGTGGLGYVTSWSFNDGVFVYTEANSGPLSGNGGYFRVSTDGSGTIVAFVIDLVSPPTYSMPGQTFHRLDMDSLPGNNSLIAGLYTCSGANPIGSPCGTFYSYTGSGEGHALSTATSQFTASAAPPPPTQAAVSAPAVSRWSLLALAAVLAVTALIGRGRRQRERSQTD